MSAPRTHRGNDSDAVTDEARAGMVGLHQRGVAYSTIAAMKWATRSGITRSLTPEAVRKIIDREKSKRTNADHVASMLGGDE